MNVNDCHAYALDYLFMTIISIAEVPFLMVLIMAGGCCGPPDMKIVPKKKGNVSKNEDVFALWN